MAVPETGVTPLGRILADMIASEGPLPVERYMELCLGHPKFGYYVTRDPIGATGDFITAPEISQVFGELIGVWCVHVWQAMGSPKHFNLVEFGPGRGTLMADLLRATKGLPAFSAAAHVHLVEMSPALRAVQRQKLEGDITWHDTVESLPSAPSIMVANEFFDALPIQQFERRAHGQWFERCVGLMEGQLCMGLSPVATPLPVSAEYGAVWEFSPQRSAYGRAMASRIVRDGGALLAIDYGHLSSAAGDTLQAVKQHAYVDVLQEPGEVDLTSHVDFAALAKSMVGAGAVVSPALTQGAFLGAMGLEQRVNKLTASLPQGEGLEFIAAAARLADHDKMGNLFKVMVATHPSLATPYPFGTP